MVMFFLCPFNKNIWTHFLENQSSNELETYLPSYFLAKERFTARYPEHILEKER